MHNRRVVITGMSVISPIGCELDTFWDSLSSKQTGIRPLSGVPTDAIPIKAGGEAIEFTGDITDYGVLDKPLARNIRKNQKVMCREIELGVAACQKALQHSRLSVEERDPTRSGIVYGCDYILTRPEEFADGVAECERQGGKSTFDSWPTHGLKRVSPLWLLKYLPNMPASHVAILNDLRGPSNSLTNREASNNLSVHEAAEIIRRGAADMMLAGSTGSHIHPLRTVHVSRQMPTAEFRTPVSEMSRPFCKGRNGVVLGEGAAAVVLESIESATSRGATIWGEVLAGASTSVSALQDTKFVYKTTTHLLKALRERSTSAFSGSMHVHACGRSELENDHNESAALCDFFGSASIPVVAAKGNFGSLAAGGPAVEMIASLLALHHGKLFPALHANEQDPACGIQLASDESLAGDAFVHLSYTPQGQASGILVGKYAT